MKNPPHPGGFVLRQCIEPLGLSITVARNTLLELVNGKLRISPETAVRTAKVFGGTEEGCLIQRAQPTSLPMSAATGLNSSGSKLLRRGGRQ